MLYRHTRILVVPVTIGLLAGARVEAQQVDLVEGTLDGNPICSLTLDDMGEALGRPSFVKRPNDIVADVLGPTLFYHSTGLQVRFSPGATGEQPVMIFSLHLTRTWDEENREWFNSFPGTITPDARPEWTVTETAEAVQSHGPIEQTPDERREELEEAGLPVPSDLDHTLRIKFQSHDVVFFHEPITRFLESVNVLCSSGGAT